MHSLGFDWEALDFFSFIAGLAERDDDLQIMCGIGGERAVASFTPRPRRLSCAITRDLAVSGAPHGIRANSISPGTVETPAKAEMFADPDGRAAMVGPQLIKRLGRPDDIASAALYLASSEASFVTGINLVVDGGYAVR